MQRRSASKKGELDISEEQSDPAPSAEEEEDDGESPHQGHDAEGEEEEDEAMNGEDEEEEEGDWAAETLPAKRQSIDDGGYDTVDDGDEYDDVGAGRKKQRGSKFGRAPHAKGKTSARSSRAGPSSSKGFATPPVKKHILKKKKCGMCLRSSQDLRST